MTDLRKAAEMALEALQRRTGGSDQLARDNAAIKALRQALAQEQEPVAWVCEDPHHIGQCTTIYASPPKREWVGLTEEEFFDLLSFDGRLDHVETPLVADLIRAIQTKLKEKNT